MPTVKTWKKKAPRRRAPMRRRRAGYRSNLAKSEFASLKETHDFSLLPCNTMYRDYQSSLARHIRASSVGHGYREYRITKLDYQFIPQFDTFAAGGVAVPQFYYMVDKDGTFATTTTAEQLMEAGAKPRRFDDKTININIRPTALGYAYDANNATNVYAKPMTSPWLSTNKFNLGGTGYSPSSIDHLGIVWIVDGDPSMRYQVRVTAHFQFRKPSWQSTSNSELPPAIQAGADVPEEGEPKVPVVDPPVE